jgi:predicted nucleotidyltransferase
MEKPKDRDFVETKEGLLFCVVGYLHPQDKVTAYLKYIPDRKGKWKKGTTRYSRVIPFYHVSQVENTYKFLNEKYPEYLYNCPIRNIMVSSVPMDNIEKYYKPRDRLAEIIKDPQDKLEYKLRDLTTILTGLTGLKTIDLGVTGSILTRSHSPEFSDIDLTVYGLKASTTLKKTLLETRRHDGVIQPFNSAKQKVWSIKRNGRFPLDFSELMEFAERRWNYGEHMGTYFSIHPIRTNLEITEKYGDNKYFSLAEVKGKATISDVTESIYLPAIYRLDNVEIDTKFEVNEVASYEGLYADMFYEGEIIEFRGNLERVEGKNSRNRVVIGGAGSNSSYLKLSR